MKNKKLITISITSAILLSACGTSMYEQSYWKNSSQKSDWDIDSLQCEEKARIAQASARELAENQSIRNMTQNLNQQMVNDGGKDFGAVYGLLGSLLDSSSHSHAKDDTFVKCMKDKRWNVKKKVENN